MSDIHALSGAYAVDALDQFERVAFERHLAHCAHCRGEVDGLREASTFLAELTPMVPPAGLRERVLAEVATVRPLPPVVAAVVVPVLSRRTQPRRWTAGLVAAAAVVAALGVGTAVTQPWRDDPVIGATPSVGDPLADAVLAAPDAEEYHASVHGGEAVLVRSRQLDKAVMVTRGMSDPPSGHVFELWFKSETGALTPAGLMPTGSDNTVVLDGNASDATAVGITIEPESGSTRPSNTPTVVEFKRT